METKTITFTKEEIQALSVLLFSSSADLSNKKDLAGIENSLYFIKKLNSQEETVEEAKKEK